MEIARYRRNHAADLFSLYREATARVPHCRFIPSREAFEEALTRAIRAGMDLYVAEDAGRVVAFGALTSLPADNDAPRRTAITMLLASDEGAGEDLLRVCRDQARGAGAAIRAFPDTHNCSPIPAYNAGWCGLSDRQPLVARLLVRTGFTPYYRELHLCLAGLRGITSAGVPPDGVTLHVRTPRDHPYAREWRALRAGVEVGACYTTSVAHLTDDPAAARWGYVQGLGVEEPYRRHGVARWLMAAALADMAQEGFEGCWLTTGATNWPAQRLYLSQGFEVVDGSTCFRLDG